MDKESYTKAKDELSENILEAAVKFENETGIKIDRLKYISGEYCKVKIEVDL